MKLQRFLARMVLPTLVAVVCPTATLAAAKPKPAPAFPPAVAESFEGKDPAKVTDLDLRNWEIRDKDLATLKPLTQLEGLDLTGTQVSDAG
ncbi:MAG: hypothetical protein WC740_23310, partial [Verrucomicrobiia bacterium]